MRNNKMTETILLNVLAKNPTGNAFKIFVAWWTDSADFNASTRLISKRTGIHQPHVVLGFQELEKLQILKKLGKNSKGVTVYQFISDTKSVSVGDTSSDTKTVSPRYENRISSDTKSVSIPPNNHINTSEPGDSFLSSESQKGNSEGEIKATPLVKAEQLANLDEETRQLVEMGILDLESALAPKLKVVPIRPKLPKPEFAPIPWLSRDIDLDNYDTSKSGTGYPVLED